jgi:3-demethoxyubiquinol 3-hydroxylase
MSAIAGCRPLHTTSTESKPIAKLSQEQRDFLDSALRVNQAGELAATLIYTAQTPPLLQSHPNLRSLMKHMHDQEAGHFTTFNKLLAKHRIRPTAMYPVWQAAASVLGWSTGVMGREAAMACTEAVETEIGNHYNGQVRELFRWMQEIKNRGEAVDPELEELINNLKRIRDEELEHLDHAVDNDAKQAQPYEPLTNIIRYGCRGAIWISERI